MPLWALLRIVRARGRQRASGGWSALPGSLPEVNTMLALAWRTAPKSVLSLADASMSQNTSSVSAAFIALFNYKGIKCPRLRRRTRSTARRSDTEL